MICHFCRQILSPAEVCHNHPMPVLHWFKSRLLHEVEFSIPFEGKYYSIVFIFGEPNISGKSEESFSLSEAAYFPFPSFYRKEIINLNSIPNISPENIHQKLPLLLTFQ